MPEDASLITSFLSFRAKHLSMETNSTISFSTGHPLHLARDNRQGWTDRRRLDLRLIQDFSFLISIDPSIK